MTYIYSADKTNLSSYESDFHVHAWTSSIRVYFFEIFQSDFTDFHVNKKKTLKTITFVSLLYFLYGYIYANMLLACLMLA